MMDWQLKPDQISRIALPPPSKIQNVPPKVGILEIPPQISVNAMT